MRCKACVSCSCPVKTKDPKNSDDVIKVYKVTQYKSIFLVALCHDFEVAYNLVYC